MHRFIPDADASLLGQVVGQPLQLPQRVGLVQAARAAPHGGEQMLPVGVRHGGRAPAPVLVAQALDAFGLVALEPAAHGLLALAHDRSDGGGRQVLLSRQ